MEPALADLWPVVVVAEQATRWKTLLDRGLALNVRLPAQRGWPDTPHAEPLLVLQRLHHGNDHRTHIGTVLGAHGRGVPHLDGWAYWAAAHHRLAGAVACLSPQLSTPSDTLFRPSASPQLF